ncbi:MAG: peptidase T [Lentimicrobiaceae bacterium]|nr:peptidase T [Lentimicrobiaceae bacterium]
MRDNLLNRFLRYVSIDTQSNPYSNKVPSTHSQLVFAEMLAEELRNIGLENVSVDKHGIVMGFISSNTKKDVAPVGFIAHLDTAPSVCGKCNPQIVNRYDGSDIVVNEKDNIILDTKTYPELLQYIGQTIIHTDGNSLLGADDKAGIAEIIAAMEHIVNHPEIVHGKICVAFTPDEEIGTGIDCFDVEKFAAQYAYTVDGGELGELEYENFNAAKANICIEGVDVHPGYAKGKMLNSQLVAMELESMLPKSEKPEQTSGYEGFFLLTSINGTIEKTNMGYLIREHDAAKFEHKKQFLQNIVQLLQEKYPFAKISCTVSDQYRNMREKIEEVFFIVEIAEKAMLDAGVTPVKVPIRGGTDGAKLSFRGLPCPNLFTGGHNFHGKREYIVLESMEKASQTIVNIVKEFAKMG